MNIRFSLIYVSAVLALSTVMTSCNHDIDYIPPEQSKKMQYDAAFAQSFGMSIDSKNDWGFGDTHVTGSRALTRAGEENATLYATGRVLCEDLGSSLDFDFNDIVFDAFIYKDGSINIEIKARGGTLPVSVAGVPVTMKQMSNTGINTDNFQLIKISAEEAKAKGWREIVDIPIVVQTSQAGEVISFELTAQVGKVPQKICTHIGAHWPKEYTRIDKGYPNFRNYVAAWHTDWTSEIFEEYLFHDIY